MTLIVDASVVVKWFSPEAGWDEAAQLMRQPLSAPDSLVPECVNALRRKVLRGHMSLEDAMNAAHVLARAGIACESTQPLAAEILELSTRLSLTAYDCAYLALARELDGVLITADTRLLERCRRPDAADLANCVRSLFDDPPMVQERPVRPYIARRHPPRARSHAASAAVLAKRFS